MFFIIDGALGGELLLSLVQVFWNEFLYFKGCVFEILLILLLHFVLETLNSYEAILLGLSPDVLTYTYGGRDE